MHGQANTPIMPAFLVAMLLSLQWTLSPALALPWHAQAFSHRAIVQVTQAGSSGVDVAHVRLLHSGLMRPDAHDLRIFDADGRAVPYQVTFHDPQRDTLISIRSPHARGDFAIYFGHAQAEADPMRAIVDERVGAGPPRPGPAAGGWIPRAGLVLVTQRRPRAAANPLTIEQMQTLIDESPGLDGADYVANISHGLNLFGDSDYYISIYRGWIELPRPGRWGFATASNEASFSFLNGDELVHWPGRHTEQRGKFGEKSAEHDLNAGLHYVEYYHEEVLLYQVAFLGWKPPGEPHYVGIPDRHFPQPHRAQVVRYEQAPDHPTLMPRITLVDSTWPRQRSSGQYTRHHFEAVGADTEGWTVRWSFGDGAEAAGRRVEHVHMRLGEFTVTMSATAPGGRHVQRTWPLTIFAIEHLEGPFRSVSLADYRGLVAAVDPAKLDTASLIELGRFHDEVNADDDAALAGRLLLARNDADAADRVDAHLLAAGRGGTLWGVWHQPTVDPAAAADHLAKSLQLSNEPTRTLATLERLIRVRGIDQGDAVAAGELYGQAESLVKQHGLVGQLREPFRRATIAIGDVRLWHEGTAAAAEDYRTAEALNQPPVPSAVRNAKVGSFPEAIQQHLDAGRTDDAQAVLDEWLDRFPVDRLRGEVLFFTGQLALTNGNPAGAIRPLRLAIRLAEGAAFEAEARYRLARSLQLTGDADAARNELRRLADSGLAGEYRDRAIEELKP